MRFRRKVWSKLVAYLRKVVITVKITRRAGEWKLRITGADSGWHVGIECVLSGKRTSRDKINAIADETVIVGVERLESVTSTLQGDTINVFIRGGEFKLKTRGGSGTANYDAAEIREEELRKVEDGVDAEKLREMITKGTIEEAATGEVTASFIHSLMIPLCVVAVKSSEITPVLASAEKMTGLVELVAKPKGAGLLLNTEGASQVIRSAQFQKCTPEGVRCEYTASYLKAFVSPPDAASSTTRLIMYERATTNGELAPSVIGVSHKDEGNKKWPSCYETLVVMSSGPTVKRRPTVAQRRVVKNKLNDMMDQRRAADDNEREVKRAKMIEDVRRKEEYYDEVD